MDWVIWLFGMDWLISILAFMIIASILAPSFMIPYHLYKAYKVASESIQQFES